MAEQSSQGWTIGISLGTANIRTAVFRKGKVEVITDENGSPFMPAYVAFHENGYVVGTSAKNRASSNPKSTLHSIKRLIGHQTNDEWKEWAQIFFRDLSFAAHQGPSGEFIMEVDCQGEKRRLDVVEVIAMQLRQAKRNAEVYLGGVVDSCVIGIPACFGRAQRHAIEDAAEMAGMEARALMNAPAAIFNAHALDSVAEDVAKNIVVLDMGAGFFNVALAWAEGGIVDIESTVSSPHVGGNDFDRNLLQYVSERAREQDMDIWSTEGSLQRVRQACEVAKVALSSVEKHDIVLGSLVDGKTLQVTITRAHFERLCQDLFLSSLEIIDQVFREDMTTKSQIHEIILAGGSCQIPRLRGLWEEHLDLKAKRRRIVDFNTVEVHGLAIQAARLSRNYDDETHSFIKPALAIEAETLSIGIAIRRGMVQKIVNRNDRIPLLKSQVLWWDPWGNNLITGLWEAMPSTRSEKDLPINRVTAIHFFEGEGTLIKDNRALGAVDISSLLFHGQVEPLLEKLEIQVHIDARYRLMVVIRNCRTGDTIGASLNTVGRVSSDVVVAAKKRLEEYGREVSDKVNGLDEAAEPGIASVSQAHGTQGSRARRDSSTDKNSTLYSPRWPPFPERPTSSCGSDGVPKSQPVRKAGRSNVHDQRNGATSEAHDQPDDTPSEVRDEREAVTSSDDVPEVRPIPKRPAISDTESGDGVLKFRSPEPAALSASFDAELTSLFSATKPSYTDKDFERISNYLSSTERVLWATVPRIYTVLRLIDQLGDVDTFLRHNLNDMWFPFTATTLPESLASSVRAQFLEVQPVVYSTSKSYQLETGEKRYAYFAADDPIPLRRVGFLGRGARGNVDKVISTQTQRLYARKLFRKSRGIRREDVQSFKTELDALKKIDHKHCVSLVATYSDPKFFALLMLPVGDCNLERYCELAAGNVDRLSLLRSFFGCLAGAVAYLHAHQIRHRDIKPQNVIVRGDEVFVADFGIAFCWEGLTRATTTADTGKTLVYAAPEVARVEPRNEAADVWSLGCVFFEMATVLHRGAVADLRRHFLDAGDSRAFHANVPNLAPWVASLRSSLSRSAASGPLTILALTSGTTFDWSMRMLKLEASQRPTAAELFEDIVHEAATQGVHFCGMCCQDAGGSDGEELDAEADSADDADIWGDM